MTQQAPERTSRPVEDRVADLELLLAQVLARARAHPVGRKVLAYLGLESGELARSHRPPPKSRARQKGEAPARPTGGQLCARR